MEYSFTLDSEEWGAASRYRAFLRKCRKKFWELYLPVFFIYLGLSIMTFAGGAPMLRRISYVVYTIVFSAAWAVLLPYIGKWSYQIFLHNAGIQRNDTIRVQIYEDRLVVSSTTGSAVHYYAPGSWGFSKRAEGTRKKGNYKEVGRPISDIYESDIGIYFWAPLQTAPAAYIDAGKCDAETFCSLRRMLKSRFGEHDHLIDAG